MVAVDVEDMLADGAPRDLVKLGQQPLAEPDGAILQPYLDAGFGFLGLVEYDPVSRIGLQFRRQVPPSSGELATAPSSSSICSSMNRRISSLSGRDN